MSLGRPQKVHRISCKNNPFFIVEMHRNFFSINKNKKIVFT